MHDYPLQTKVPAKADAAAVEADLLARASMLARQLTAEVELNVALAVFNTSVALADDACEQFPERFDPAHCRVRVQAGQVRRFARNLLLRVAEREGFKVAFTPDGRTLAMPKEDYYLN